MIVEAYLPLIGASPIFRFYEGNTLRGEVAGTGLVTTSIVLFTGTYLDVETTPNPDQTHTGKLLVLL